MSDDTGERERTFPCWHGFTFIQNKYADWYTKSLISSSVFRPTIDHSHTHHTQLQSIFWTLVAHTFSIVLMLTRKFRKVAPPTESIIAHHCVFVVHIHMKLKVYRNDVSWMAKRERRKKCLTQFFLFFFWFFYLFVLIFGNRFLLSIYGSVGEPLDSYADTINLNEFAKRKHQRLRQ